MDGTISVSLTQAHIDKGEPTMCMTCAVALAINEALKREGYADAYAHVMPDDVCLCDFPPAQANGADDWVVPLPADARWTQARLDNGVLVLPLSFPLDLSQGWVPDREEDEDDTEPTTGTSAATEGQQTP